MGPKTIPIDGFNYNDRIALQQNEQLLLNIVRMRYAEVPFFLNVNSVINQYSREGNAGVGANFLPNNGTNQNANVGGRWSDRPTITYTPVAGQAFSRSMLTPLPPAAVFFLIQSGWSAERMMRLTTHSVNGLKNGDGRPDGRRLPDPRFSNLLRVMTDLQNAGMMGLHVLEDEDTGDHTIDVHFPEQIADDSIRVAVDQFKQLLNLEPDSNSFSIRFGLIQENREDIFVQTNSMLEIMVGISWFIEVPNEHVEEGRTASTYRTSETPLIRVLFSKDRPEAPFLAVKHKDHWFYIDDRDLPSKTTFAIVQILMSLSEDGGRAAGPLISIGN